MSSLMAVGLLLAVLCVFKPVRGLLGVIFGKGGPAMVVLGFIYGLLFTIYKDHVVIFKNFAPRRVVFKTLEKE